MQTIPFIQGFGMGGGLIMAIGAQNAFVLSQGVRRNHHFSIALLCSLCDAILITIGVMGVGNAVASNPVLLAIATWGGAAFLFWYGVLSVRSAMRPGALEVENANKRSLRACLLTTLAVTLLNPHCYLDTVVLLGSMGGQFHPSERFVFAMGAMTASCIWFFALSFGGQLLAPLFRNPRTWRMLDLLVAAIMWTLCFMLVRRALG